jgi:hypothetical protein
MLGSLQVSCTRFTIPPSRRAIVVTSRYIFVTYSARFSSATGVAWWQGLGDDLFHSFVALQTPGRLNNPNLNNRKR